MTTTGTANTATYRADGLRASKTTGSGTTYYLYDGGEPIIELNSAGTVTALNVFAPDGLVARQSGGSTVEYVMDQPRFAALISLAALGGISAIHGSNTATSPTEQTRRAPFSRPPNTTAGATNRS